MIEHTDSLDGVEPRHLEGFFVGWPSPPSPERHLELPLERGMGIRNYGAAG